MDPRVRELVLLTVLAGLGLGLAWAYEADYFALVFATEAAFSGVRGHSTVSVAGCRRVRAGPLLVPPFSRRAWADTRRRSSFASA